VLESNLHYLGIIAIILKELTDRALLKYKGLHKSVNP